MQLRRLQLADFDLSSSASRQYIPVYESAAAWFEDASKDFKNQSQVKKSHDLPPRTQLEALIPANATWPPEESQEGDNANNGSAPTAGSSGGVRATGMLPLLLATAASPFQL